MMQIDNILVGVCGAHMSGLALNHQLLELDATFVKKTKTKNGYRMFELTHKTPFRPGMFFDGNGDSKIELEVWSMPTKNFGTFIKLIASPLCIGTIFLENDDSVFGFLCEPYYTQEAKEITAFGSWRTFIAQ